MELLSQYFARLRDHVREMTPGSRLAAGALVLVVVASLGYMSVTAWIEGNHAEPNNPAKVALRNGRTAAGPKDPIDEAIDNDKIWLLPETRQAIYNKADEEVLEKDICDFFADVAKARVKLNQRTERGRLRSRSIPTASIGVKMKPGTKLGPELGVMICNYVAAAAGRDPAEVSLFDPTHGTTFHGSCDATTNNELTIAAEQRAREQECQEKVRRLLSFIPNVVVVASSQPRQPHSVQRPIEPAGSSTMTSNQPRVLPMISQTVEGPTASHDHATPAVRVSVRVPSSYFEQLWREQTSLTDEATQHPKPEVLRKIEASETQRIKQLIASVLPATETVTDRAGLVTVVSYSDFNAKEKVMADSGKPIGWMTDYRSILGLLALVATVFFAFRSLMHRRTIDEEQTSTTDDHHQPPIGEGLTATIIRGEDSGGIDLDGALAQRLIRRRQEAADAAESTPFGALHKADSHRISRVLADESPQTIALVLSHLPPQQAGRVLIHFSSDIQADVVRRLVDLEQTEPEVLREIEASLTARLAEQVPMGSGRVAGLKAIGGILESSQPKIAQTILGNLAAHDQNLASELKSCVETEPESLSFDDLAWLDLNVRRELCESGGREILGLALIGATPTTAERLLEALPTDEAETVRRSLGKLRLTRLRDVDAAREQLIALAQSLYTQPM